MNDLAITDTDDPFSIDDDDDIIGDEDVTSLDPLPAKDYSATTRSTSGSSPAAMGSADAASTVSANAAALVSTLNNSLGQEASSSWSGVGMATSGPGEAIAFSAQSAASLLQGNEQRIVSEHLGLAKESVNAAAYASSPQLPTAAPVNPIGGHRVPGTREETHPLMSSAPTLAPLSAAAGMPVTILGSRNDAFSVKAQNKATAWYENVGSIARRTANTLSDAAVQAGSVVANAAAQADAAVSNLDQRVIGGHQGVGAASASTTMPPSQGGLAQMQMHMQSHQQGSTQIHSHLQQKEKQQNIDQNTQDIDNTKKSILLSSALGESDDDLLPGERVIMFLSHLSSVFDSSGTNTGINTNYDLLYDSCVSVSSAQHKGGGSSSIIWCCAMTFYRVILFSYRECDFPDERLTEDVSPKGDVLCVGTDEMDLLNELVRTASVSRQYQLAQSKARLYCERKKRHHLLQMPLASIERVERVSHQSGISTNGTHSSSMSGTSLALVLHGKDNFRNLRFTAPNYNDAIRAYEALNTYAFPGRRNLGYLFAFESRRAEVMASIRKIPDGESNAPAIDVPVKQQQPQQMITARSTPKKYEPIEEFNRLGIFRPRESGNSSPWTILKSNTNYSLCPSYPSVLVGPRLVNDDGADDQRLIRRVAAFRSEGRMPVLTWGNAVDGASIWRSSQPRVGLQGNRSSADERYLRAIADCASSVALPPDKASLLYKIPSRQFLRMMIGGTNEEDMLLPQVGVNGGSGGTTRPPFGLKIMDLRPKSSAVANRTQGYGYENTSYYTGSDISFYGIGNIHAVRDAYQKISNICQSPSTNDVQWLQTVEDTKWLGHVRLILSASWQTAFHVHFNRLPVLLHCSHGWDRTSQVAAIAELLLDPFYRTKGGFATLVEKDFLSFGHPFHTRCGHGEGKGERGSAQSVGQAGGADEGQLSPIFIQFLDCVFQLVNQYPEFFEFNVEYLLVLSEHVYSCRFGTLLCDTERERELIAGIRQRTHCLWEYLESRNDLTNPFYSESVTDGVLIMPLPTLLRNVTLWVDRHCMYGPKPTVRCFSLAVDSIYNLVKKDENKEGLCGEDNEEDSDAMVSTDKMFPYVTISGGNHATTLWALKKAEEWKRIAQKKQCEIDILKEKLEEGRSRTS